MTDKKIERDKIYREVIKEFKWLYDRKIKNRVYEERSRMVQRMLHAGFDKDTIITVVGIDPETFECCKTEYNDILEWLDNQRKSQSFFYNMEYYYEGVQEGIREIRAIKVQQLIDNGFSDDDIFGMLGYYPADVLTPENKVT